MNIDGLCEVEVGMKESLTPCTVALCARTSSVSPVLKEAGAGLPPSCASSTTSRHGNKIRTYKSEICQIQN